MISRLAAACLAAAAVQLSAVSLAAQPSPRTLPAHEPLNPAIVARSGLYHQPFEAPASGWTISVATEYGSAVERALRWPDLYLYDAELLRVQVTARHDLGERAFVRLEGGVTGAYDGFADSFFESYHQLIRWVMPERDTRPRNEYASRMLLTRMAVDRRDEGHTLLPTDVRATVGVRIGEDNQTAISVTLPTAPSRSAFARRVPSVSAIHTLRAGGERLSVEGSAGVGYTPRTGELEEVQRTTFHMLAGGIRVGLARNHSLYGTLFHHGAAYRGTGFPELDRSEYSADFGYLWRSPTGRRWRVGLTEDLRRRDPGIDLVMKVSVE